MNLLDLISLVLENLGRRKGRVALTAIGVIIGTAAIVILVSLGIGLQQNATARLFGIGDLTQIRVFPKDPGMYEGQSADDPVGPPAAQKKLSPASLAEFENIPGVVAVVPWDYLYGGAMMKYNRLEGYGNPIGVAASDLSLLGLTAQTGTTSLAKGSAVIGATVANNFQDPRWRPGQEPPPPPDLMGQNLDLTLIKWDPETNEEIHKKVKIHVVGVLTEMRSEPDWSIYLPLEDVTAWNEWFMGKRINREKDGYNMVIVKVDDVKDTLDVADQIKALEFNPQTDQTYVQGINSFYTILQAVFGGVGAIALLVAAIGIANTMAMAILERTREIGLMKAVGATNKDVLSVFLGEAAGIGLIGGLGGVILGWSAGQVINVVVLVYMAGQSVQQGMPPSSVAVSTPPWLLGFALLFAVLIGLLSGIYPALQAATLIPIKALKYE
ncbi:MAG TPA: ABC transporter permease [Anaerolineales bacterium]|nr:ABC transporter permease [Anaerolineales bacterium]